MWAYQTLPNGQKRLEAFASPVDEYEVVITEGVPNLSASLKATIEAAIDTYFMTRNPFILGLFAENNGAVETVSITAVIQNTIDSEVGETGRGNEGVGGVNNLNTIPFENIPYENINAIGKQWIRRFALALTKEILGQVRGKFSSVPIPGESVTLNASDLLSQARAEMDQLREELKTILEDTTYDKLAAIDSTLQDSTKKVLENVPAGIYVG